MKKLPDKIGSTLYRETNFMKELCSCVWAEDIEPTEIEERWCSVVFSYGLSDNEWLDTMFDRRASWIPAYFRDLFMGGLMRTTSRSESENSFFGGFIVGVATSDNIPIIDCEKYKVYYVNFISDEMKLNCSCKKFERNGIFYRHALYVLKEQGFDNVPDQYLLSRWSKLATCQPICCNNVPVTLIDDCNALDVRRNKIGTLWSEVFSCVTLAEQKPEYVDELMGILKGFKDKIHTQSSTSECNNSSNTGDRLRNKTRELEMLLGTKIPTEVIVLPPIQSKTKGSGKRMISQKEKAAKEHKRAPKKCNACGELRFHDSRNCPGRA
ncbi:protein FAR-RED IMPAIRED RESPONSE 1-like [Silene latifolia]|uniref:protein FAR-RED IMPAIRED RESPONSE 1-like n=1 Tax=Silene latifolia TaxID=37657 RepID=UPI003D77B38F